MYNGTVIVKVSNRSSDLDSLNALIQIQEIIGKLFKYTVETNDPYPAWTPNDNSVLLKKAIECIQENLW